METPINSFWEKSTWFDGIEIAIIGSGIVGLTAAIFLKRKFPKRKIAILEAGNRPQGASTKNAGFACFGSAGEILDDLKTLDQEEVSRLIKLRWDGLKLLRGLVSDKQMEYQACGGNEVFRTDERLRFEELEDEIPMLNGIIEDITGLKNTFSVIDQDYGFNSLSQMIFNKHEGSLHPVKMINHLLKIAVEEGMIFHWNCEIASYDESGAGVFLKTVDGNSIKTAQLLLCTNAFSSKLRKGIDLKPARNQVIITKPIKGLQLDSCFHYDRGYVYFRNYRDRILLGGARNLDAIGETTEELGANSKILDHLKRFITDFIIPNQNFEIDLEWSGIIAVGQNKKPIVERISDKVYLGVRMGGMGVAIGSKVGQKLCEIVD